MEYEVIIEEERTGQTRTLTLDVPRGQSIIDAVTVSGKAGGWAWSLHDVTAVEYDDRPLSPDPDFPDRPQSLDFARVSMAARLVDAEADGEIDVPEVAGIEGDALAYMLKQRVIERLLPMARMTYSSIGDAAGVAWIDGFAIGAMYQKRGGHREVKS